MVCEFHYEILPLPPGLGCGVRLYLYGPDPETGEKIEYGAGVYRADSFDSEAMNKAYAEAQEEGYAWVESRSCE